MGTISSIYSNLLSNIQKRKTINTNYQVEFADRYISVDGSSNEVTVTLPIPLRDGRLISISAVDITNDCFISGMINGVNQTIKFGSQFDNYDLIWDLDMNSWVII